MALEWNAPPGCSDARDVLSRVRKLAPSSALGDGQLRAEATIAPSERGRLQLKLVLHAGKVMGERHIDGRTCEDLAGATAVVLALLLSSAKPLNDAELDGREQTVPANPLGQLSEVSSPLGDGRTHSAASAAAPSSSDTQAPPEPTRGDGDDARSPRRWHGIIQLPLVSIGVGPLPRPSFGFSAAGGIRFESWSLLAEGGGWLKQALKAADQPNVGANVQRIEGALRGCRAIPFGQFELAPCLRVSVQHLWARGTGAHVAARTAEATWVAAGIGAQAHYPFGRWFRVFAGVDAQVQASRPRISVDGVGRLGQLRPAAFTITVGSQWIL